jgi:hypothetical protein
MPEQLWAEAKSADLASECIVFDSWYASLKNLKFLDQLGWCWLIHLKANRLVSPDGCGNCPISTVSIPGEGRVVYLKGYGWVRVFQRVAQDGDVKYWVTNDVEMGHEEWEGYAGTAWRVWNDIGCVLAHV